MAEAAVETPAARFFCHRCTQEINPVLPDYICPRCQSGFIEELAQLETPGTNDEPEEDYNPLNQIADLWSMLRFLGGPTDPTIAQTSEAVQGTIEDRLNDRLSRPGPSRRAGRYRISTNRRGAPDDSARTEPDRFLQNLVSRLSESTGLVTNASVPVFLNLHSNPGDYAWGRGGWNAIINQLINHLDVTGPAPLPTEKINEIPTVEISQEQVDKNLQCTVCMEDFKLSEPVRRLSCDHHFHNECIIPWLELHGTCPICRKLLNENSQDNFTSNIPENLIDMTDEENIAQTSEDLSRNYNSHQPSVYDFTDDFD